MIDTNVEPNAGLTLQTHLAEPHTLAFSQDKRSMAIAGCASRKNKFDMSSCSGGGIEIWDINNQQPNLRTTIGFVGANLMSSIQFDPISNAVNAVADYEHSLITWHPNIKVPPIIFQPSTSVKWSVTPEIRYSPDSKVAAIGGCGRFVENTNTYCTEGRLELWDVERQIRLTDPLLGHGDQITALAFSKDGKLLVSGSDDGEVVFWDWNLGKPTGRNLRSSFTDPETGKRDGISELALSPNGRWLAGGGENGLYIWDVIVRQQTFQIPRLLGVDSLAFSGDSRRLVFNGDEEADYGIANARVWDVQAGTYALPPLALKGLNAIHSPFSPVVGISPDGAKIASADHVGHVVLWNVSTEEPDAWACRVLNRNPPPEDLRALVGDESLSSLCNY